MSFGDIIKKSIVEEFSSSDISLQRIVVILLVTTVLAGYIFGIYFLYTSKNFYSRSYNITLVGVTVVTAGIVIALQSNFVISLGMVGALSIVRFRTAIKDPIDLLFMFWAISIGIICGANLFALAIVISLTVSASLLLLQATPIGKAGMLLVVNLENLSYKEDLIDCINKVTKKGKIKTENVRSDKRVSIILELKMNDTSDLMEKVSKLDGVTNVSLVTHDGEVNFGQ